MHTLGTPMGLCVNCSKSKKMYLPICWALKSINVTCFGLFGAVKYGCKYHVLVPIVKVCAVVGQLDNQLEG